MTATQPATIHPGDVMRYRYHAGFLFGEVDGGFVTVLKVTAKTALVLRESGKTKRVKLTSLHAVEIDPQDRAGQCGEDTAATPGEVCDDLSWLTDPRYTSTHVWEDGYDPETSLAECRRKLAEVQ